MSFGMPLTSGIAKSMRRPEDECRDHPERASQCRDFPGSQTRFETREDFLRVKRRASFDCLREHSFGLASAEKFKSVHPPNAAGSEQMTRSVAILLALGILAVAYASGNGPAMLKSLETGVARGVGYQIAHSLFGEHR
jgi:hypothetical protein